MFLKFLEIPGSFISVETFYRGANIPCGIWGFEQPPHNNANTPHLCSHVRCFLGYSFV